ncbi:MULTISPECIES: NADH-quinone oxidoreductase subunit A [unclassified Streptomyces]|uniref:NADH-quinone oxidoreductase subunit A n=2 Tax=Streptomyces TaxID=1883 RepID=UPI00143A5B94|nr:MULTISPECIES: NADH-quinone oxidoreductase subunit A [unclassified Streptomyces]NJA58783.1 NADH-quinone oxidoreductase subunit A [Streptomyces sp. NEAU-H3]WEH29226.1 NADH-quinone oxidoreductase subunit A [Streptomyces sp. AM 3-1-1]
MEHLSPPAVPPSAHGVPPGTSGVPLSEHGGAVSLASGYFHAYTLVGVITAAGVLFVAFAFAAGRLLRPVVPTREKFLTYECGVDPVGEGWAHTQVRYYVYAFLYVIFAVDSIFLFPWATVFAAPGYGATTLVEMFVFLGFLAIGLLYAWKKGVLEWT